MSFTDTFIRRPVFSIVLSLIIFLVGLASYNLLPFRQYPRVDATTVSVMTSYSGASANIMESYISSPLESALSGVNDIDYLVSTNKPGSSRITIYFKLGTDMDTAAANVGDMVSSVRWKLPKAANDPIIMKQDPNSNPIIFVSFTSDHKTAADITDYLQRYVQPDLGTISGVAEAKIFGLQEYAMRIWLNPRLMASRKVTASDLKQALVANHLQSPTGRLEDKLQEFDVVAKTDLKTPEQFNNLIVKSHDGQVIRIRDIGHAELSGTTQRVTVDVNGVSGRMMGVTPRSDANPLEVAENVRKALTKLQKQMPADLKSTIVFDTTQFIRASIKEVKTTLIEAALLVVFVIFLFLGSMRALWIPLVTIPLSLIGVCTLMLLFGFSLNTLTLLALVLAIGMVVDDAIVVLENIHRHMEQGLPPKAAAIVGAREIKFAVIAMTLTLAAVYAPIGFTQGLTGRLFKEFAFTLASAVVISGFIALSLSPMMCSKLLTSASLDFKFAKLVDRIFSKVSQFYNKILNFVLNLRYVVLAIFIAILASCVYLFTIMPSETAPMEDTGVIMAIIDGPGTANLNYTKKYTAQFSSAVSKLPEVVNRIVLNGIPGGVSSAMSFMILKPWGERESSIYEVTGKIYPMLSNITGVIIKVFPQFSLPGATGSWPIDIALKTTGSYDDLANALDKLKQRVQTNPKIMNVDTSLKFDKPQILIDINRNKAGLLGISMSQIGDTLNIALGEPSVSQFEMNGKGYDVIPKLEDQFREKALDLLNIYMHTNDDKMVPLSNLLTVSRKIVPRSLDHFQQLRSAKLTATLAPGYSQGEALAFIEKQLKELNLANIQYDYSGQTRQFVQESGQMARLLLFAILFIYLVLAAQFESFRDPLVVMLSVPLSITAALLALKLAHGTLNIYTWIGLVTLVGLISKHGILMVEFANRLQEEGESVRDAILTSATIRLRPILMTTAAMVLGAMPLALATGAGAVSRKQIGIVIASGMSFGTLLTLFVVPTIYTFIATRKKHFTTGHSKTDELLGITENG